MVLYQNVLNEFDDEFIKNINKYKDENKKHFNINEAKIQLLKLNYNTNRSGCQLQFHYNCITFMLQMSTRYVN